MLAKLLFLTLCNTALCLREETMIRAEIGNHVETEVNETDMRALLSGRRLLGYQGTQPYKQKFPLSEDRQRITACMQPENIEEQYPRSGKNYAPTMIWPEFGGSEFGGTVNYQRFVDVVAQLKQVPDWERGDNPEIVRGNDLGMCTLYENLWRVPDRMEEIKKPTDASKRFQYRTIFLGAPPDIHAYVRPILDRVLGAHLGEAYAPWTEAEILKDVQDFFNSRDRINAAPFQDVPHFLTQLLHKVHLGIGFDHSFWTQVASPEEFTKWQDTFLMHAVLGGHSLNRWLPATSMAVHHKTDFAVVTMRVKIVRAYMDLINKDTRKGKDGNDLFPAELKGDLSEEEWMEGGNLYNVAAAMFDSLVFAGGLSVVQGIQAAMALLNSEETFFHVDDSAKLATMEEADAEAFTYELYRLIPQVVGFPWWDPKQGYNGNQLHGGMGSGNAAEWTYGQRIIMQMATALRDPEAWGEDAWTFKLRDLDATLDVHDDQIDADLKAKYPQLTVEGLDLTTRGAYGLAWVEQANEYPEGSALGPMSRGCPGQALSIAITKSWIATYINQKSHWRVEALHDAGNKPVEGELEMVDTAPFHLQSVVIKKIHAPTY